MNERFDIVAEAERIVRQVLPRRITVHYAKKEACAVCGEVWPCQVARDILSH